MLATAGLMLSVAALLVVIGLGETQIVASESKSTNLFGNRWFDIGLLVAAIGIFWGLAAIAAIGSQGNARREFPDLAITVFAVGRLNVPHGDWPQDDAPTVRLDQFGLRISNHERDRNASISMSLWHDLVPGTFGGLGDWPFYPPRWDPPPSMVRDLLRFPIHLGPDTTRQGEVVFEIPAYVAGIRPDSQPRIEVLDHNSGRRVTLPGVMGGTYGA
jgi:hypothetical protein